MVSEMWADVGIGPYKKWGRWYEFAGDGSRIGAERWAERGGRP